MYYETTLTVPASTAQATPVSTELLLVNGTIERVEVQFWQGALGNVGVRLLQGQQQVWPTNAGSWFVGNGQTIAFDERYQLREKPFSLTIEAYNEDTDYAHEVIVRVLVSIGNWSLAQLLGMLSVPQVVQ